MRSGSLNCSLGILSSKYINLEIIPLPSQEVVHKLSKLISGKDAPVLASAISCKADYLVTGDKKDFSKPGLRDRYGFRILSPSEFIEEVLPKILQSMSE